MQCAWRFVQVLVPGALSGGECGVSEVSWDSVAPVWDRREQGNCCTLFSYIPFFLSYSSWIKVVIEIYVLKDLILVRQ